MLFSLNGGGAFLGEQSTPQMAREYSEKTQQYIDNEITEIA